MGSFLVNCGVSNRVLQEDSDIKIIFLSRLIQSRNGELAQDEFFNDWYPEKILLSATQNDYGHITMKEGNQYNMAVMMHLLASQSNEPDSDNPSHPSWKQYFNENIKSFNFLEKANNQTFQKHLDEFTRIIHSSGIAYKNNIQGTTSMMKLCHVDSVVIDTILESPVIMNSNFLKYNEKSDYFRKTLSNFEDFLNYMILIKKKKLENFLTLNQDVSYHIHNIFENSDEDNYHALLNDGKIEFNEDFSIENILNSYISQREKSLFFSYAQIMGIQFKPSLYASQDYDDSVGVNYRNVMQAIFTKQKSNRFDYNLQNNFDNGEDINGNEIPQAIAKDYLLNKDRLKNIYMNFPEINITDNNKIINDSLDDIDFLKKTKEKKSNITE